MCIRDSNYVARTDLGTNTAPPGTLQAPAGFIPRTETDSGNDGTPASVQEMIFVLINNYNWSITTN